MAQNLIRLKQLDQSELSGFISQATVNTGIIASVVNSIGSGIFVSVSGDQNVSGRKTFFNSINISGDLTVNGSIRANEIIDFTVTGDISGYTGQFQALYVKGQPVATGSVATASSLFQTGENLYNYINGLSGTLSNSGSVLYTYITQLSGDFDTSGAILNSYINNLSGDFNETGAVLNNYINNLSGVSVLTYSDQTILGTKYFNEDVYIHNLYVTGDEFIANVINNFIESPYILLNLTGGAIDGGIFFVTGVGFTGINDYGPIIGFDHSNKFKFGVARRSDDLSSLPDIASVQQINSLSGDFNETGALLHDYIRGLSGALNLSGAALNDRILGLSGDFNQTGALLNNYINNLSGVSVLRYGDQLISGNKTFFGTTTFSGQSINLIDTALNLSGIGDMTFTGVNINFINSPVYISGTNLRVVGDVLANNLVYTSGNQNISGIKTFINNQIFSGNINVSGTGIFNALDLNNIDNLALSGVDITITSGNIVSTNSIIAPNLVYVTGFQLVSGIKIFGSGNFITGANYAVIAGGVGNRIFGSHNVIAGGERNIVSGDYSLAIGGRCNFNSGYISIIAGGECNTVNSNHVFLGGGCNNRISTNNAGCSVIAGGVSNFISFGTFSAILGGSFNCITGADSQFIGGGARNCIGFPYSVIVGGCANKSCSSFNFIGGGGSNEIQCTLNSTYGVIVGGSNNINSGCYSFMGGGGRNLLGFPYSVIVGGCVNQSHASHSFIGGGFLNTIRGFGGAGIVGGSLNTITGDHAFIGGGARSEAGFPYSTVVGGCCHTARGCMSFVGGGDCNTVLADYGYIVGGRRATVSLFHSGAAVLGDGQNRSHLSSGAHSLTLDFASGIYLADPDFFGTAIFNDRLIAKTGFFGLNNRLTGLWQSLGGGQNNFVSGFLSFIGGGDSNCSIGSTSVLAGGTLNCILADYSAILGGEGNVIRNCYSTIGGGFENRALDQGGFIGGGELNCTSGTASVVVGGSDNRTTGSYSFIGGGYGHDIRAACAYIVGGRCAIIQADHGGSAVLGDGENRTHLSSGSNTLTLDFNSGIYFARPRIFGDLIFSNATIDLGNSRLVNAVPQFINETTNFVISGNDNGRIILANSTSQITGTIVSGNSTGFNTSIIQVGAGQIFITGSGMNASVPVSSYNNQYKTAGAFATISILHTGNNRHIMYGNTI